MGTDLCLRGDLEGRQLEQAILRQALAEWRDRQIVAAAALVNAKAVEARAAFDKHIEDAAVSESLFNPTAWATVRVDRLMTTALKPALDAFLAAAAEELAAIHADLAEIGEALRRPDAISMPSDEASETSASTEVFPNMATVSTALTLPADWMTRVRGSMIVSANALATGTGNLADTIVWNLGQRDRLNTASAERIRLQWMGNTGEPKPVRAQLIALIDEAAYAGRGRLS